MSFQITVNFNIYGNRYRCLE